MKSHRSGFTLIELLVVIAIIGILSAVVLASLSTARSKGNDASILADLDSITTQAVEYSLNSTGQSYGTFGTGGLGSTCPTPGTTGTAVVYDSTIEKAVAGALSSSGGGHSYCYANGSGYAIAVSRPPSIQASNSYFWCVDSTGNKCGNDGNNGDGATPIVGGVCVACTVHN